VLGRDRGLHDQHLLHAAVERSARRSVLSSPYRQPAVAADRARRPLFQMPSICSRRFVLPARTLRSFTRARYISSARKCPTINSQPNLPVGSANLADDSVTLLDQSLRQGWRHALPLLGRFNRAGGSRGERAWSAQRRRWAAPSAVVGQLRHRCCSRETDCPGLRWTCTVCHFSGLSE
jgi:hypothetical protein